MRNLGTKTALLIVLCICSIAGARDRTRSAGARPASHPAVQRQPAGEDRTESSVAATIMEEAWNIVDTEYAMFGIRDQLDWDAVKDKYLAEARNAGSYEQAAGIVARMLGHLRDGHVWVKYKGKHLPVYRVPHALNVNKNTKIYGRYLGRIQQAGRRIVWAKTTDSIGFIMIRSWSGGDLPDKFDDVMEQMRDTRGLIIDVRWNSGGDSELSKYIAARFVDTTRVYGHYRYRNGPGRSDLTEKIERALSPRGPWRYDRPVILLMGQGCVSACESFCAMMAACPNVTTMGDRTRGSTGFPIPFKLDGEIEIYVPQWISYLPDGQVIDGRGVMPDVPFVPGPASFAGDRDELFETVLDRLGAEPLPATAIAGPTVQAVREKEKTESSYRPKIVSVEPGEGSRNVAADTVLRVRFDRPMHPSTLQLEWKDGGFRECGRIRYDETQHEFAIPIRLEAGCQHRIVVNPDDGPGVQKGFQSVYRTAAEPLTWAFSTKEGTGKTDGSSVLQSKSAGSNTLRSVIERFNDKRRSMWSFVETVRTREYGRPGPAGYQCLRAYTTRFTLDGRHGICADIGEMTGMPLFVFGEGNMNHVCGYYRKTPETEEMVFCLYDQITEENIVVADPFDAHSMDVDSTIGQSSLQYGGRETVNGNDCHIISAQAGDGASAKSASSKQWWIDHNSNMLARMVDTRADGWKAVSRFSYERINEALDFMTYIPDISYQWVCENKKMVGSLEDGCTGRFIDVCDGTRGNVCGAWGSYGEAARNTVGVANSGG